MTMSPFQALVLGLLQGVTELFPVSSLGHSVILPSLFHWHIQQNDPFFLTFLVATHAATAIVLFLFFWKDWMRIISGILRSLQEREIKESNTGAKLGWLLVVGTIPAGILGLLFEDTLKSIFSSPKLVAVILMLNGLLLYGAEMLRRRAREHTEIRSDDRIAQRLNFKNAIQIGVLQCIALIAGFSRTGSTLTGGLLVGLSHEDAARFSFLLATPIIGAAAFLKLLEVVGQTQHFYLLPIVIGVAAAAIGAYISVHFLNKYFETKKLTPFALYCFIAGGLFFLLLSL